LSWRKVLVLQSRILEEQEVKVVLVLVLRPKVLVLEP